MRKLVLCVLVILAVTVSIFTFFFSSPKYQIGDNIIEGKYLDTAYEAFINSGGCPEFEFKSELATVDVNNEFAIWIASTETDEFMLVKMSLKKGQYCSLDDFTIIKITDCNIYKLEREFTLGKDKSLQYTIIPYNKFKKEENTSIKTNNFIYNNKSFVFVYKIVDNSY